MPRQRAAFHAAADVIFDSEAICCQLLFTRPMPYVIAAAASIAAATLLMITRTAYVATVTASATVSC